MTEEKKIPEGAVTGVPFKAVRCTCCAWVKDGEPEWHWPDCAKLQSPPSSKDEILKRCEEWFASYMHDRESYDEATLLLAALRNGATVETSRDPYKRCQHDLLLPASTVVVDDDGQGGRCTVCLESWSLRRALNGSGDCPHGNVEAECKGCSGLES